MTYIAICVVAFLAAGLTFISGFGLGTLLLPAFAVFFAIETAVVLTALVHFLNGVFKLFLVWRHVRWQVVVRFGLPGIAGAFAGAWLLLVLAHTEPLFRYSLLGRSVAVMPTQITIGALLFVFSLTELSSSVRSMSFSRRFLVLGGVVSGFFGGLAGLQGALRSAFLMKAGLTKEAYVATGAAIAFLIDVSRLTVYADLVMERYAQLDYALLGAAAISAFLGSFLGSRYLKKLTMRRVQAIVGTLLLVVSIGLMAGLL